MVLTGLLETSLSVGIVVLVLFMLSVVSGGKFLGSCQKAAWLFLAARLLFPVSILVFPHAVQMELRTVSYAGKQSGSIKNAASRKKETGQEDKTGAAGHKKSAAGTRKRKFDIGRGLLCIWMAGTAVFLAYHAACYTALRRKVTKRCMAGSGELLEIHMRTAQEMGLKRVPELKICPGSAGAPFLTGFLHPCLALPERINAGEDFSCIVRHELVHYAKKDMWYKLLLTVANALHWFNPAVWLMRFLAETDVEIACDNEVIRGMAMEERKGYIEVILACIQGDGKRGPLFLPGVHQAYSS